MESVNSLIRDRNIRHQIGLQRYSSSVVKEIMELLKAVDRRLVERLSQADEGTGSAIRLQLLLDQIRASVKEAYQVIIMKIKERLRDFFQLEFDFQIGSLKSAVVVFDIVTPEAAKLYAAVEARPLEGKLLKDIFEAMPEATTSRVHDAIRLGFVEGRTTDQIIRDVVGKRSLNYADGIMQTSRRGAEGIVRTALNHVANATRNEIYNANEELIKGVQWVSTLDMRTTRICQARDGKVFPLKSGPRPPAHMNCRSTTTPVLRSWKELGINLSEAPAGTRASMDGQVPDSETYQSWLKRQSADTQDEVLGKKRALLFRKGDLPLDRFVDDSGKTYKLEDLKRLNPDSFKSAGI